MFRDHVFGKNFAQCTLEGREEKKSEKRENINISKVSKHVLNLFWANFFWKKNRQCTLEGRGLDKTLVKGKTSKFQNCPRTFPKNIVWECFDWFVWWKKLCPVHPADSKKIHKNPKVFKFSKMSKNDSKSVQTCFDVIFSKFFIQCTLEGREARKFQKNGKNFNFSKFWKRFQKCPNLFRGDFVSNFSWPVHTGDRNL